jgi:DNA-binding FrmR family transcriptional regulator
MSSNPLTSEIQEDLITRLKRVEGQARGVQKMIIEGRSCEEIVLQITALKAGATQVAARILVQYLSECLSEKNHDIVNGRSAQEKISRILGKLL